MFGSEHGSKGVLILSPQDIAPDAPACGSMQVFSTYTEVTCFRKHQVPRYAKIDISKSQYGGLIGFKLGDRRFANQAQGLNSFLRI